MVLGSESHSRQGLHRQCGGPYGRQVQPLPAETQNALQQLACLGNSAEFTILADDLPGFDRRNALPAWEAVRAGVILRSENSYRFLHDRVQEAAYSLIPEQQRAETHLRIGRLLAERIPSHEREERIFEIVNQFNRATHLITSNDERSASPNST